MNFSCFVLNCKKRIHAFILGQSNDANMLFDSRILASLILSFPFFLAAIVQLNLLALSFGLLFLLLMALVFVWCPVNIYSIQSMYQQSPPCSFLTKATEKFNNINPSYLENVSVLEYWLLRWTYVSHQQENRLLYRHIQAQIKPVSSSTSTRSSPERF